MKLSAVSNSTFFFYESMACVRPLVQYIYEKLLFLQLFHVVFISHYKNINSIDDNLYKKIIDAKSKQNCKLSTRYTAEDKRV